MSAQSFFVMSCQAVFTDTVSILRPIRVVTNSNVRLNCYHQGKSQRQFEQLVCHLWSLLLKDVWTYKFCLLWLFVNVIKLQELVYLKTIFLNSLKIILLLACLLFACFLTDYLNERYPFYTLKTMKWSKGKIVTSCHYLMSNGFGDMVQTKTDIMTTNFLYKSDIMDSQLLKQNKLITISNWKLDG